MTLDVIHLAANGYPNTAEGDRRLVARIFGGNPGRVVGFVASPDPGMNLRLSGGEFVVRGRSTDGQGFYYVTDPDERALALRHLTAKYPQYVRHPPPGDVLALDAEIWRGWP